MANWNHAKDSEVITSLAEKPSAEEGASLEAFDNIYNDKQNKEDLPNLYLVLFLSLVVPGSICSESL